MLPITWIWVIISTWNLFLFRTKSFWVISCPSNNIKNRFIIDSLSFCPSLYPTNLPSRLGQNIIGYSSKQVSIKTKKSFKFIWLILIKLRIPRLKVHQWKKVKSTITLIPSASSLLFASVICIYFLVICMCLQHNFPFILKISCSQT